MTQASTERSSRSIEMTVDINAPSEAVWRAISDAEELTRWFPPEARVEPGVGGSITLSWGEGAEGTAPITVWEEGRRLKWVEGAAEVETPDGEVKAVQPAVDFVIEARAGGTATLRLVHSGFDADAEWDEYYEAVKTGWIYFMWNLQMYLERHRGVPRRMVSERRRSTRPKEEIWDLLFGPAGLNLSQPRDPEPGSALRCSLGEAGTFDGTIKTATRPDNLAGVLPALNDGLLFVEFEMGGETGWHCGIWLSLYGVEEERADLLQAELTALADRVF